MQPPVGINDDPGIWTLVTCTLQKCHISSSVQHVLKINLCSASRIHFPVDSPWIWFPWGSVPQLDSSLLMALRLLVCRTPSRTNTSVFSPILCRLPKAEEKKKKKTVYGIQGTPSFDLSFCQWRVTDVTNTACYLGKAWLTSRIVLRPEL